MNPHRTPLGRNRAFTLLEMTIVILVLLTLVGIGTYSSRKISTWKLGREAGETLRSVYNAQRMYLADNPTTKVSALTATQLIPYLTNGATALPTVVSEEGTTLTIKVNVSPPVVINSGGTTYDPSGSSTDSLWDVGQP